MTSRRSREVFQVKSIKVAVLASRTFFCKLLPMFYCRPVVDAVLRSSIASLWIQCHHGENNHGGEEKGEEERLSDRHGFASEVRVSTVLKTLQSY